MLARTLTGHLIELNNCVVGFRVHPFRVTKGLGSVLMGSGQDLQHP